MMRILLVCVVFLAHLPLYAQNFEGQKPRQNLDSTVLWSDGQMLLRQAIGEAKPRYGYAVLKSRKSAEALQVLQLFGGKRAPVAGTLDLDYVMVPINRIEDLSQLAALAHQATGSCGGIELIPANHSLNTVIKPAAPIYSSRVVFPQLKTLVDSVQLTSLDQFISTVSSLPSRYFKHPQGELAHNTIRQLWEAQMLTGRWILSERSQPLSAQKSVVARLVGSKNPEETIIVGAHLDSIIGRSGDAKVDASAGADDDASGVAVLTEILRQIELGALQFDRSLELQAYAAEEVGLVGSREIASSYANDQRIISGMLQLDMAYYSELGNSGIIFLLEEYTSRDLRRSAIDWMRQYLGPIYKLGHLPPGSASDHKSFWEKSYPTLFPFEDPQRHNPHIHTSLDTAAQFDDGLLLKRITQLALLFVAYQGGLSSLAPSYADQKSQILPAELKIPLPIAIQESSEGYYLAVAAPADATTLEFCAISAGEVQSCYEERETLEKDASVANKKIFYSALKWTLAPEQKWRVFAYNEQDELLAWRQLRLKRP